MVHLEMYSSKQMERFLLASPYISLSKAVQLLIGWGLQAPKPPCAPHSQACYTAWFLDAQFVLPQPPPHRASLPSHLALPASCRGTACPLPPTFCCTALVLLYCRGPCVYPNSPAMGFYKPA